MDKPVAHWTHYWEEDCSDILSTIHSAFFHNKLYIKFHLFEICQTSPCYRFTCSFHDSEEMLGHCWIALRQVVEWHSHRSQKRAIIEPRNYYRLTFVRCWAASSTETEKSQAYWTCPSSWRPHMHMHTASKGFPRSLSPISAKNGWVHSYSDGEVMTMARYPLSLNNGWDTFNACMCFYYWTDLLTPSIRLDERHLRHWSLY